jgi:hypothetical protein
MFFTIQLFNNLLVCVGTMCYSFDLVFDSPLSQLLDNLKEASHHCRIDRKKHEMHDSNIYFSINSRLSATHLTPKESFLSKERGKGERESERTEGVRRRER